MLRLTLYIFFFLACGVALAQPAADTTKPIVVGAERMEQYLPLLQGKNVALLINHTSVVGKTSLLDTLLKRDIKVKKVFAPEHGIRGKAAEGENIKNEIDSATGIPVLSLHGDTKKPTAAYMDSIDVVVFDIQDVGARFYTYISTLQYAMEACAEYGKELVILDRPNPNGHYVDGPVLDTSLRSFVGMQPIPIVYGMTEGEYATMLVGQKWFAKASKLKMHVITCENYDHNRIYQIKIAPSPNLRNNIAIACYPTTCLFEGTVMSVGRGTDMPFQQWGHPDLKGKTSHTFMPVPYFGQTSEPLYAFKQCFGQLVAMNQKEVNMLLKDQVRLTWLLRAYQLFPDKDQFFTNFFEKLAGTKELRKQVQQGLTEEQIKATWQPGLKAFKKIRAKYLLYKDFDAKA
ncbi:MAG: DUF1343 domain-containing protein [Sphingobacteriales bacterium]|nr:MAG: DUF1343 domain-containing protein [Sphingobacteriales bacterium]